jgi:hypothetical protein
MDRAHAFTTTTMDSLDENRKTLTDELRGRFKAGINALSTYFFRL